MWVTQILLSGEFATVFWSFRVGEVQCILKQQNTSLTPYTQVLLLVDSLSCHPLSYAEDRPSDRGRRTRLVLSAVSIEDVEVFACVFCSQIILLDLGFIFISSSSVEAANSLSAFFCTDHVMVMHCLPLFIIWCMDLFLLTVSNVSPLKIISVLNIF